MRGQQFTILLAGGMFKPGTGNGETGTDNWLANEVRRRMAEVAPRSSVRPLAEEPALGAVRLAIAEARGGAHVPPYIDALQSAARTSA